MKFITAALFAVAASLSGALAIQPCVITQPQAGANWAVGSQQLINWVNANPSQFPIQVFLDDGSSNNYHVNVPAIISNLPAVPNYVLFTVPSTVQQMPIVIGGTYAIQFGIAPDVAYGGPVVIQPPNGGPPVITTPAPPPVSGSAPVVSHVGNTSTMGNASNSSLAPASSAILFPLTLAIVSSTTALPSSTVARVSTPASSSGSVGSSLSHLNFGALIVALPLVLLNL